MMSRLSSDTVRCGTEKFKHRKHNIWSGDLLLVLGGWLVICAVRWLCRHREGRQMSERRAERQVNALETLQRRPQKVNSSASRCLPQTEPPPDTFSQYLTRVDVWLVNELEHWVTQESVKTVFHIKNPFKLGELKISTVDKQILLMGATRRLQAAEMQPNSSITLHTGWHLLPNLLLNEAYCSSGSQDCNSRKQKKKNMKQPWRKLIFF